MWNSSTFQGLWTVFKTNFVFKDFSRLPIIFKPVRTLTLFCPIPRIGLSNPCTFPASAIWDLTLKRTPTRLKWSRDVQTSGPSMIMPEQMSHPCCTSWTGRQLKRDELWAVSVSWLSWGFMAQSSHRSRQARSVYQNTLFLSRLSPTSG